MQRRQLFAQPDEGTPVWGTPCERMTASVLPECNGPDRAPEICERSSLVNGPTWACSLGTKSNPPLPMSSFRKLTLGLGESTWWCGDETVGVGVWGQGAQV